MYSCYTLTAEFVDSTLGEASSECEQAMLPALHRVNEMLPHRQAVRQERSIYSDKNSRTTE